MKNTEFKQKLKDAFDSSCLMKGRNRHTINELMHVLTYNEDVNKGNYNISIKRLDGCWTSIPCMDAFVDTGTRGIWFNDAEVEFEIDECEGEKYCCISVHETEKEPEWFGVVRWCEADLKSALEDQGYPVTENNIAKLYEEVSTHWFTDHMISAGWEYMYDQIGYGDGWDE